jgi:hypothetical protein
MAVSDQYIALANNLGDIHLYEHEKPPHEAPHVIDIHGDDDDDDDERQRRRRRQAVVHMSFSADGSLLLMINKRRNAHVFRVADMVLLPALALLNEDQHITLFKIFQHGLRRTVECLNAQAAELGLIPQADRAVAWLHAPIHLEITRTEHLRPTRLNRGLSL